VPSCESTSTTRKRDIRKLSPPGSLGQCDLLQLGSHGLRELAWPNSSIGLC